VASLAVLALLFSPVPDEWSIGSNRGPREPVDPRILAPTVREGIVAVRPKLTARQTTDQQSRPGFVLLAVASAAAAVLLVWVSVAPRLPSGGGPRLLAFRGLVPRGPPVLQAV